VGKPLQTSSLKPYFIPGGGARLPESRLFPLKYPLV